LSGTRPPSAPLDVPLLELAPLLEVPLLLLFDAPLDPPVEELDPPLPEEVDPPFEELALPLEEPEPPLAVLPELDASPASPRSAS
jgi:hypothetical protein